MLINLQQYPVFLGIFIAISIVMNFICILFLFVCFSLGCNNSKTQVPNISQAQGGESSGGGGNISSTSKSQILNSINQAKRKLLQPNTPLIYASSYVYSKYGDGDGDKFNTFVLQMNGVDSKKNSGIYINEKLSLKEFLMKTSFSYSDCLSKHDASFKLHKNSFSICLDIARIQKKTSSFNFDFEVLGLIVHEVSHLYGYGESDAVFFQKMTLEYLYNGGYLPVANKVEAYIKELNLIISNLELYLESNEQMLLVKALSKIDTLVNLNVFLNFSYRQFERNNNKEIFLNINGVINNLKFLKIAQENNNKQQVAAEITEIIKKITRNVIAAEELLLTIK